MSTPTFTTVCSFITRGQTHQQGQGVELLWFTHVDRRSQPGDPDSLSPILIETTSGVDSSKSEEASLKSIQNHLFLQKGRDIRLVRKGKQIPWTSGTFVEAFLWRTVESYEMGLDVDGEMMAARNEGRPPNFGQADPKMLESNAGHYRKVEVGLGVDHHYWDTLAEMEKPEVLPNDMVSTAYFSVILPPSLDEHLGHLDGVQASPTEFAHLCLEVLYAVVSAQSGRKAFKFWPPGYSPDPDAKEIPDPVLKYRSFAYWIDTVTWHLRRVKPQFDTPVAAVLIKAMKRIRALVHDQKVSILGFEKAALLSISHETTQAEVDAGILEKIACARILQRPPKEKGGKRGLLHIVTLGCHPAIYGSLRALIHYLLTSPSHPYASHMPGIRPLSKEQEQEWLDRPSELRITILESRPTCAGIALAHRLHGVVETSHVRARQLRDLSRSKTDPHGLHLPNSSPFGAGAGVKLSAGLSERFKLNSTEGGAFGTLDQLLRAVEEKESPSGLPSVSVEVVPDAALVSILSDASPGVIVLVGADRVLPGECDLVATIGSYILAWYTKEQKKATVLALVPTWTIESSFRDTKPTMPFGAASELVGAWKVSTCSKGTEEFAAKALDKNVASAKILNQESEIVPAKFLTALITEKGIYTPAQCLAFGKTRGEDEVDLCGKG